MRPNPTVPPASFSTFPDSPTLDGKRQSPWKTDSGRPTSGTVPTERSDSFLRSGALGISTSTGIRWRALRGLSLERCTFDAAYVRRLKDGDAATQRHFIRYFSDLLSIKLRSRLRSSHLVEEARQETFLRVLTALHRQNLDQPERLGAFVNSVCNNVLFELYRAESRNPNLAEDAPEPADHRPSPESSMVTTQRKEMVERALEELPAKDRE